MQIATPSFFGVDDLRGPIFFCPGHVKFSNGKGRETDKTAQPPETTKGGKKGAKRKNIKKSQHSLKGGGCLR